MTSSSGDEPRCRPPLAVDPGPGLLGRSCTSDWPTAAKPQGHPLVHSTV